MFDPSPVDDYELGCAIVHWAAARNGETDLARQAIADAPDLVEAIGARVGPPLRAYADRLTMILEAYRRRSQGRP